MIACGWSPAGSKSTDHLDRQAAFGFFRAGRAVGDPELAVLVQRVAGLDQRRKGGDGGGDAGVGERIRIFKRNVEAGDRIEAGRGALLRGRRAAHRGAARRLGRGGGALGDSFGFGRLVTPLRPFGPSPRIDGGGGRRALALPPSPFFTREGPTEGGGGVRLLRLFRDLFGPIGNRAFQRRAGKPGLRRFAEALVFKRLGRVEIFGQRPLAGRRGGVAGPGRRRLFRRIGHDPEYGASQAKWKVRA